MLRGRLSGSMEASDNIGFGMEKNTTVLDFAGAGIISFHKLISSLINRTDVMELFKKRKT